MSSENASGTPADDSQTAREPRVQHAGDGPEDGVTLLDVVTLEQRRAERYRHYFVVAMLIPKEVRLGNLARIASKSVRASNLLGVVSPDGMFRRDSTGRDSHGQEGQQAKWPAGGSLAVVFPETDRPGAEAAIARIAENIGVDGAVLAKCALYPDDSTNPTELVSMTAA